MTAYFDTSALVPLVLAEPSTAVSRRAWYETDSVASSSLAYVEVHTALAQANRMSRMTDTEHGMATRAFEALWAQITPIAPVEEIIRDAARLGTAHALRGYDAVHCATAFAIASSDLVAVSGDQDLLRAWDALGIATVDTAG